MGPLRNVVPHGVDLQDGRPCRLAHVHSLSVLALAEVEAMDPWKRETTFPLITRCGFFVCCLHNEH